MYMYEFYDKKILRAVTLLILNYMYMYMYMYMYHVSCVQL